MLSNYRHDFFFRAGVGLLTTLSVVSCSGADPGTQGVVGHARSALGPEDALAEAYANFKTVFENRNQHVTFRMGFGYTPGISSEPKIVIDPATNATVSGEVTLHFEASATPGRVTGTLQGPLAGTSHADDEFDLWLVKNTTGSVKPEAGDTWVKVGSFQPDSASNLHTLSVDLGLGSLTTSGTLFDLDMVVITLKGTPDPTTNIVATGARSLFEKRYFREKSGATLDVPQGTLSSSVASNDLLVRRGAQVFFNETFAGNGRTCGTCHRAENNLTIDEAFIDTLPSTDPLFTAVMGLEDPALLETGLIRENVDGNVMAGNTASKFVMRSVPHTFSMSTSVGAVITASGENSGPGGTNAGFVPESSPPDQKTGWGGDGAPGRGTLGEFAVGAVVQHFPLSISRFPNSFRLPTQEEVDALEAFQLFSGRQRNIFLAPLTFKDPNADAGRASAFQEGQCVACHRDITADSTGLNFNANTGVERLLQPTAQRPRDSGFGVAPNSNLSGFGNGQFNTPPLMEAADTAPFFHNNAALTIEEAVNFYRTPFFQSSPGFSFARPELTDTSVSNIAAFLRTTNALLNIGEVEKRTTFVRNNPANGDTTREDGNTDILLVAIADVEDAISVLTVSSLSSQATTDAKAALNVAKALLQHAATNPDSTRYNTTLQAEAYLDVAKNSLMQPNPNFPESTF